MTDFRFICVRFKLFILDVKILSVTERHSRLTALFVFRAMEKRNETCSRLLHKLLGYLSKVAPKICKSCPKVAHFTKKLLKSCFLSTQKNQFLLLMKVNLCTSIRVLYLFIYSFLLADISIPTEMIF